MQTPPGLGWGACGRGALAPSLSDVAPVNLSLLQPLLLGAAGLVFGSFIALLTVCLPVGEGVVAGRGGRLSRTMRRPPSRSAAGRQSPTVLKSGSVW